MDYVIVLILQVLYSVASLALICAGLAVIFGMMRVINLAHGEFIMLGGFTTVFATQAGIPIVVSMLIVAPIVVAVIGLMIERLVVRHLYGRMIDTMLATWGLSLLLIGAATMLFGNSVAGISAPFGSFTVGQYGVSVYEMFIVAVTVLLLIACYLLLRFTKLGLIARGTMQNSEMAASLGISPSKVYSITFTAGAALNGLAGALLAPLSGVVPTMGKAYVAKAFITVISGGEAILTGLVSASGLLGSVGTLTTFATTPVVGDAALLLAAIILLRFLPNGITGRFFKGSI
ncbi:branched-chain amino acid ABC transporter permease [Ruegeria sp. HKCCD8929]|uniref:ABC transporter permease subunit n=1 Tax=Ruegeria sp. HKCCD8929 TaxID=2683006 RepID=UPI0014895513|nr:branched-chain amino acid ABC transporter permease [Ruegeria sp. HKCCD8929]